LRLQSVSDAVVAREMISDSHGTSNRIDDLLRALGHGLGCDWITPVQLGSHFVLERLQLVEARN